MFSLLSVDRFESFVTVIFCFVWFGLLYREVYSIIFIFLFLFPCIFLIFLIFMFFFCFEIFMDFISCVLYFVLLFMELDFSGFLILILGLTASSYFRSKRIAIKAMPVNVDFQLLISTRIFLFIPVVYYLIIMLGQYLFDWFLLIWDLRELNNLQWHRFNLSKLG